MHSVLLVDDSEFMRKWIKGILHDSNQYKVIAEASNGREGILAYNEHQPDIMLMDVAMGEMDGVETLEHLMRIFPSAKVVMCSSLGQQSYMKECIKLGAKDFIVKPYFDKMIDTLNNVLT